MTYKSYSSVHLYSLSNSLRTTWNTYFITAFRIFCLVSRTFITRSSARYRASQRSRLQLSVLILSGTKKDLTVLTSHVDIKAPLYCSTILVLMMLIFLNGPVLWTWRKRGGYCWNLPCVSLLSCPRTIPRIRPTLSAFSRPERRGCRRRVFTSATGDDALWTIRWNRVRV